MSPVTKVGGMEMRYPNIDRRFIPRKIIKVTAQCKIFLLFNEDLYCEPFIASGLVERKSMKQ
jgi:hypothetical protein